MKLNIRGQTIAFSSRRAKEKKEELTKLENKILALENSLCQVNNTLEANEINHELEAVKSQLVMLREPEVKAAILRSRAQIYEEGEKSTKFFCNLEKWNYINKTIYKLNIDGNIITDPADILSAQKEFYKNIYSSKISGTRVDYTRFLNQDNIIPLDNESQILCEGPVTQDEVK